MGLRAARTSAEVHGRIGAVLWPAASDLEKPPYSLNLRAPIDDSSPQTGGNRFRQQAGRYLLAKRNPVRVPSGGLHCASVRRRVEFRGLAAGGLGNTEKKRRAAPRPLAA